MRRREAIIRGLDPDLERDLLARGRVVAGVDEAGRGPLAGPVVAAAVVLDLARMPRGLADSKCLSPARRAALFDEILATAEVAIATASPAEIDRLNIRGASLAALCRALRALPSRPDLALVDGRDLPEGLPCAGEAMVRGDGRVASIAAASIVAKVTRDRLMARLDGYHPGYGFAGHAGYPTPEHREALRRLGPCPLHRLSFAPVRAAVRDRPGVAGP